MGSELDHSNRGGSPGFMRRTVGGAFDATVGRVGDKVGETARGISGATARQVVDDLEPYLIAEAIPRIVDGLVPYLTERLVPRVVDGVADHIGEHTVPQVMTGATPTLVDDNLPDLMNQLRPYLETELVPAITAALIPYINETAAPQIVDAIMPKIRNEVVPQILDDIVDDPKVRDLIREQSQGMILEALERLRRTVASADDVVERLVRALVGRRARPQPVPPQPMPLPGRRYVNAGLVSRALAFALDAFGVALIVNTAMGSLLSVLESLFGTLPTWLVGALVALGFSVLPLYLALSWTLLGKTVADTIMGQRLCDNAGARLGLGRALIRAWLQVLLLPVWLMSMVTSPFAQARRGAFDIINGAQVRYFVHGISHDEPPRRLISRHQATESP